MLRRDKIGFIFQAFNLVPTLTALENITLPVDAGRTQARQGVARQGRRRPSASAIACTTVRASSPAASSSASPSPRALASRPAIIFGDEPTGNLDSRTGAEILSFMRSAVRDLGQTIVMVTHDPAAASYAERVIFLADGSHRRRDVLTRPPSGCSTA